MTNLDVLVVYSSKSAISSAISDSNNKSPFKLNSDFAGYNLPYSYLLQTCQENGMSAGFSTSADVIGPGACQSYWTSRKGKWTKIDQEAHSLNIFDKIAPSSPKRIAERKLLFSTKHIRSFNHKDLHSMFFDKLLTYSSLPEFCIPTVFIPATNAETIKTALEDLHILIKNHKHSGDFLSAIVLKDRFGTSGNHVYAIKNDFVKNIEKIMTKNKNIQFVIQPFLQFDKGFSYKGKKTTTDIRLIFHHNKIVQTYIRLAKKGDFRCNQQQGGEAVYITKSEIPAIVRNTARTLIAKINRPHSLFALDFIVSNAGTAYLLEGNFGPGLYWDPKDLVEEKMSKQLIDSIVDEFSLRILGHIT